MARQATVAAVDLGASSGRVALARVGPDRLEFTEIERFANVPVTLGGTLHWDVPRIHRGVLEGLRAAGRATAERIDSIGLDSWAVDYGLLDGDGRLLGNPVHYRDRRTEGVMERVFAEVPAAELYRLTGVQFQPFNTLFQLVAAAGDAQLRHAGTLLLIPDLITYWLTGRVGAELTNASTTQLLAAGGRQWAAGLMLRLGIRPELFPALRHPGEPAGELLPEVAEATGLAATPVTTVASHDTASAVVGVPAAGPGFGYLSCGTWSLAGVELDAPVLTADSRRANFTNELGIDGTVRYLRNVMGLWLLQECQRVWRAAGQPADLAELLARAARAPAFGAVVDPDDPEFLPPGDMPARIARACRRTGQTPPRDEAATVRCILDSLALAYRAAFADAERLTGRTVEVIHLVGGGARNELLCQLTADACGRPVEAGPVEAGVLGNVLVQGRALGVVGDDLAEMRALLRRTQRLRRYEPTGDQRHWAAAAARLSGQGRSHQP